MTKSQFRVAIVLTLWVALAGGWFIMSQDSGKWVEISKAECDRAWDRDNTVLTEGKTEDGRNYFEFGNSSAKYKTEATTDWNESKEMRCFKWEEN
jgi:hypothetical protein